MLVWSSILSDTVRSVSSRSLHTTNQRPCQCFPRYRLIFDIRLIPNPIRWPLPIIEPVAGHSGSLTQRFGINIISIFDGLHTSKIPRWPKVFPNASSQRQISSRLKDQLFANCRLINQLNGHHWKNRTYVHNPAEVSYCIVKLLLLIAGLFESSNTLSNWPPSTCFRCGSRVWSLTALLMLPITVDTISAPHLKSMVLWNLRGLKNE